MQSIYKKWTSNRFKTKWSKNPIKRFRYCIHEYQHMIINGYPKVYAIRHWMLCYIGLRK